jgi:hypothetical protein
MADMPWGFLIEMPYNLVEIATTKFRRTANDTKTCCRFLSLACISIQLFGSVLSLGEREYIMGYDDYLQKDFQA